MKKLIVGLMGAAILAGCNTCKTVDSGTTFAQEVLAPYVKAGELPGAVNVFYKDGAQETCCIGFADVAAQREITLDDVYMQCSQTKGFCGVTIAKLVEEGKLNLDDPVSKYLPEFATLWVKDSEKDGVRTLRKAKNVLTVRMVLNHTGGFPFEIPAKQGNIRGGGWSGGMPIRSVAVTAASQPLLFDPGTGGQYSNTGLDVAAAIVEMVVGEKWDVFLKRRVLDPLGMKDTCFRPTDAQLEKKVELYDVKGGEKAKWRRQSEWMQRPYNDDRVFPSAGAGLWTTVRDQLKFYRMLMNLGRGANGVRILKEETVKRLLARSTRPKSITNIYGDVDDDYSLGLVAPPEDTDDAWFGHGGAWGTQAMVNYHRKQLSLWAYQLEGMPPHPWKEALERVAEDFFKQGRNVKSVNAHTGRKN